MFVSRSVVSPTCSSKFSPLPDIPGREELYRQFYAHRNKMGDPTSMRSPEQVFGSSASGMVWMSLFRISSRVCVSGLSGRRPHTPYDMVCSASIVA